MQEILIVVDMQNDFVTGALGSPEAVAALPKVVEKVRGFDGRVLFTRDTHEQNYLDTQEGHNLPVVHCVRDTPGWQICPELEAVRKEQPVDKCTFGSVGLGTVLRAADKENPHPQNHADALSQSYLCDFQRTAAQGVSA